MVKWDEKYYLEYDNFGVALADGSSGGATSKQLVKPGLY